MVNLTDGAQETVESASGFIAQEEYTFPVYYDTDMSAAMTYSIYAIPLRISSMPKVILWLRQTELWMQKHCRGELICSAQQSNCPSFRKKSHLS